MTNNSQTIYALSSGALPAAIAVVRISGAYAFEAARLLGAKSLISRKLVLTKIQPAGQEIIDMALVCAFPKKQSITGEDLVELHLHGSIAVIDELFLFFSSIKDLRPAEPGEFTKRALINGKMDITEEVYYNIIKQKTASLVAACCATGACSVTKDKELIAKMEQVGIYVGMAFQIKDDIFDYGFSNEIGKPTGIDIKERKLTLPLIYVMNKVEKKQKKLIINTIKKDQQDSKKINEIISMVINEGGIHYAEKKMHYYKDLALKQLDYLPSSPSKEAFIGLINYSINRKK